MSGLTFTTTVSANQLQKSARSNNGTRGVPFRPHTESSSLFGGGQAQDRFETISAQTEYSNFSVEELRLADYKLQDTMSFKIPAASPFTSGLFSSHSTSKRKSSHLNLLRGPGIEIHVGTTPLEQDVAGDDASNIWCLPKALVSHYSPFLKAACSRDFKEGQENRINLPEDNAAVFALFVEWMYYGDYTTIPPTFTPPTVVSKSNINAKCWVLGDKLLCTEFKKVAMNRLYSEHTGVITSWAVTIDEVRYACENSSVHSKLREMYVALVATHFSNPARVIGTAEDWDSLILEYADLRSLLLQCLKMDVKDRKFLKSKEHYLDDDTDLAPSLDALQLQKDE